MYCCTPNGMNGTNDYGIFLSRRVLFGRLSSNTVVLHSGKYGNLMYILIFFSVANIKFDVYFTTHTSQQFNLTSKEDKTYTLPNST